jgi:hypothetical protein
MRLPSTSGREGDLVECFQRVGDQRALAGLARAAAIAAVVQQQHRAIAVGALCLRGCGRDLFGISTEVDDERRTCLWRQQQDAREPRSVGCVVLERFDAPARRRDRRRIDRPRIEQQPLLRGPDEDRDAGIGRDRNPQQ